MRRGLGIRQQHHQGHGCGNQESERNTETRPIENPQDEKALNIALNKAVGEWEPVALADLLSDLQQSGYDLGATGFDAAEVDDLFSKVHDKDVKDDDCELAPDEVQPFVKPGDVWTLGRHRMVCGDSTNADDVALLMEGVKANLIVTDPPYNVAYESADGKSIQNDSMADEKFYEFLLAAFRNMAAHLAEGGSAYIFHADTEGLNFRRAFKEAGFHISGVCIWVKNSLVLGRSPYQWQHEPVLFGWLPNGKHKWFSDRKQSTIWNFDKPKRSKEHPTMKPIPLLAYPIKNSSAPNGVVMDLFGGSGSTLMACAQTDRICRTMELDRCKPEDMEFISAKLYGAKYSSQAAGKCEHTNVWGFPYFAWWDKLESVHLWIRYKDRFLRCVRVRMTNLRIDTNEDASASYSPGEQLWGYPHILEYRQPYHFNRMYEVEKTYETEDSLLYDLAHYDGSIELTTWLDDLFGDG